MRRKLIDAAIGMRAVALPTTGRSRSPARADAGVANGQRYRRPAAERAAATEETQ